MGQFKRKMSESELDPERKPPNIPFVLQLVFTMLPLISMLIIIPTSSAYSTVIALANGQTGEDAAFAGITVSAMPIAMAVALFPLHWLFEWSGFNYGFMVWFGIFVSMAGQVMYGLSYLVLNKWYLLGARFVMGLGCYQALGKTYITVMSSQKHKLYYFMWMGTVAIGVFVIGNFFAFCIDIISENWGGDNPTGLSKIFNRYTNPGWFMLLCWIIYAICFLFFWREPTLEERGWKVTDTPDVEEEGGDALVDHKQASGEPTHEPEPLRISVWALSFVFISACISSILMSSWEMYAADYLFKLGWDAHQSSLYLMGVYGIFLLLSVPIILPWLKKNKVAEYKLMIIPYTFAALGSIFFYQYSKTLGNWPLVILFSVGSVIVVVFGGLPRTAIMSLASKIVTNKHGGVMQMWTTFCMGIGRAIGPPLGSYLSQNAWAACITGICVVNVVLSFVWKDHLVPIREHPANKASGASAALPKVIKETGMEEHHEEPNHPHMSP